MTIKSFKQFISANDKVIAGIFAVLALIFIVLCATLPTFMDWVFARHENVLSWYIRPLFLIPFCLFAFYRSLAGISVTVFLLLTSMFWFPSPAQTPAIVAEFLEFEKDYLLNDWTLGKIAMTTLVPLTLALLAYSFWKRNLWLGFSTMAAIAILKSLWSLMFGGDSGIAVLVPATVGLLACCVFLYFGLRLQKKRQRQPQPVV